MKCPDRSELMMFMDGELSPERMAGIREHLESCSSCSSWIESQRRMEDLWRESWQDPADTAFDFMRHRVLKPVPWWKKQRNWMAVAAVFAVYFGVRIFLIGDGGPPMSEAIRQELAEDIPAAEMTVTVQASQEGTEQVEECREEMMEPEEAEEEVLEEQEEVGPADDLTEQATAEEAPEICLSLAETDESADCFDSNGHDETLTSTMDDAEFSTAQTLDLEEEAVCFGTSSVVGMSGGGGAGSGGLIAVGSSSIDSAGDTISLPAGGAEVCADAETVCRQTAESCEAAPVCINDSSPYSVFVEYEDGETRPVLREEWPGLFQFLDVWLAESSGETGEFSFVLDDQGRAAGDIGGELPLLDPPSPDLIGSTITVYTF